MHETHNKILPNVVTSNSCSFRDFVFQTILNRAFSTDRLGINCSIFGKQCTGKHSHHRFNIGRGIAFFIGQRTEERREKRTKLLEHYHDLKEKVLIYWLSSSVNITHRAESFPKVETPVYLATFSSIKGEDDWHKWLMQHIYDDEGYPSIRQIIEKLEVHEKKHNKFVGSLIRTLNDEIRLTLEDFPRLKEWKPEKREDCYYFRDICLAVLGDKSLKIIEQDLYLGNDRRIARSDNDTLTKLKDRIEKIRLIHKKDLQNIQNGIKRDGELLKSIQEHAKKILYELALEKPLKGKCDYERSLESTD